MSDQEYTETALEELRRNTEDVEHRNKQKKEELDSYNPVREEGRTRQSLAKFFVYSFFVIMTLILICVPLYNYLIFTATDSTELRLDLNDLLLTYSSVVGPILGFVIGYYFKSRGE